MGKIWSLMAAVATATLLTTGLPITGLPAKAIAEDVNQVVRTGQVVELTHTTITIREDAGRYTYRLSPTGRQALETGSIRPGDRVRVSAYGVWEIAYDFKKL